MSVFSFPLSCASLFIVILLQSPPVMDAPSPKSAHSLTGPVVSGSLGKYDSPQLFADRSSNMIIQSSSTQVCRYLHLDCQPARWTGDHRPHHLVRQSASLASVHHTDHPQHRRPFFAHHGISYVPIGYSSPDLVNMSEIIGGSAWGTF